VREGSRSRENLLDELRRRAEAFLRENPGRKTSLPRDIERLLHELQVYQVELEMQNEELRKTQMVLEASRDRYRSLYDFSPVGYVTWDGHGRLLEANICAADLLGLERKHLLGRPIQSLVEEKDRALFLRHRLAVMESEDKEVCEVRFLRDGGEAVECRVESLCLAEGESGEKSCRSAIIDVSEARKAWRALAESEEKYRLHFESVHDILFSVDSGGTVLTLSSSGRENLRGGEKGIEGTDIRQAEFLTEGGRKEVWEDVHRVLGGERVPGAVYEFLDRRGERMVVEAHVVPVSRRRKVEAVLFVARDVTEFEILKAQLLHSQKMEAVGTLAGGIAHDFNNILTAIMGYAQMAYLGTRENERARENLQEVLRAAHRARELVRQILEFSRKSLCDKRPVELSALLGETVKLLRASLPANISIRRIVDEKACEVLADATQLHQVLVNLCTNAAHAMGEKGGTLELILAKDGLDRARAAGLHPELEAGPYVRLAVKDSGRGMSREVMERIFEPYFTTKAFGEGSGLGLSVVHGIVKSHGGAIVVESEEGKGATFSVYLPRYEGEAPGEEETCENTPGGAESILLVDDEESLVGLGREMLEYLGYRVTGASDPRQAYEIFARDPRRFHLVVTDLSMPHMGGEELTEKLKALRRDIPVMVCTGYDERVSRDRLRELGVEIVVMKPMVMTELACKVREALDAARQA